MSLKRGLMHTVLAQGPTLLLYFITSTLMTRLLGDTGRGEYALVINLSTLMTLVLGMNIGFGITYFTARSANGERAAIRTAASLLLIDLFVVPLLLWGMSCSTLLTTLFMPTGRTHWMFWGYIHLSVMLGILNSAISGVFLGRKRFGPVNGMAVFAAAIGTIAHVVLYSFRHLVPEAWMFSMVLLVSAGSMLITSIVWCVLYIRIIKTPPVPHWSRSTCWPVVAFSLVGHASNLINLINYRFDVWVVSQYQGAAELGLYSVAVGLGQLLFQIPEPLSRVVQPFLFSQKENEMVSRFKMLSRLNFTLLVMAAGTLALSAPWLLPKLFGEVFSGSLLPLYILLPGILFSGITKLLAMFVVQRGLQHFNLWATILGAVLTIGLDLFLIPEWGISGAAFASTAAYFAILLVVLLVIRFRIGVPIHDVFVLQRDDLAALRRMTVQSRS